MRSLLIYLVFICGTCRASNPIEIIEQKLNATHSWQSDFIQVTNDDVVETGKLYIEKPGNLRFIYNNALYTIYADGKHLIYYDENIDQPTFIEIDQTPATLLLKNDLKFIDMGAIRHVEKRDAITIIEIELPDGSVISLDFDTKTHLLKGWILNDFQGNNIKVSLSNIRIDQAVDKNIFTFKRKRLTNR